MPCDCLAIVLAQYASYIHAGALSSILLSLRGVQLLFRISLQDFYGIFPKSCKCSVNSIGYSRKNRGYVKLQGGGAFENVTPASSWFGLLRFNLQCTC